MPGMAQTVDIVWIHATPERVPGNAFDKRKLPREAGVCFKRQTKPTFRATFRRAYFR